jgi:YD repeat-containing protein
MTRWWRVIGALVGLIVLGWTARGQPGAECGKGSVDKAFWQSIKNSSYSVPSGQNANALARVLVGCLASPDPELRDALGYEIFSRWIRGGVISNTGLRELANTLGANLKLGIGEQGTDSVFLRSFSALVLSEVLRQDARGAILELPELRAALEAGVTYLESERDLRGFDDRLGYIHGVAHGSDVLWRLALNSRMTAADLERILGAIAGKVTPDGTHAYTFNESDRLARAAAYAIARAVIPQEKLVAWLEGIAAPAPLSGWGEAFSSQAGLTKLHNTKAFLRALHSFLYLGGENGKYIKDVLPNLEKALEVMAGLV